MPVLLLGDSHLSRLAPYRRLLARDCTVRAVGGAAAADLRGQLGELDPSTFRTIAVSVGTNDCGVKPAELPDFLGSIDSLLDQVATTRVLMVNNPGADERAVGYDDVRMKEYAAAAGALVRSRGGSVLDIPRVIGPLGRVGRTADGIHVSKLGHVVLLPALRAALQRAGSSG